MRENPANRNTRAHTEQQQRRRRRRDKNKYREQNDCLQYVVSIWCMKERVWDKVCVCELLPTVANTASDRIQHIALCFLCVFGYFSSVFACFVVLLLPFTLRLSNRWRCFSSYFFIVWRVRYVHMPTIINIKIIWFAAHFYSSVKRIQCAVKRAKARVSLQNHSIEFEIDQKKVCVWSLLFPSFGFNWSKEWNIQNQKL